MHRLIRLELEKEKGQMDLKKQIKEIMAALGADLCGIAHVDRFAGAPPGFGPKDIYKDCGSVVVFAKRLPQTAAEISPRILYMQANAKSKETLDRIAYQASLEFENLGLKAVAVPSDGPYEYWDAEESEGRGLLSMRHAAALAGLGTLGKNTLLMNRDYGNWINIGAVLIDQALESDPLAEPICIEGCRICLDKCPSGALTGEKAIQKRCRPVAAGANARGFDVCNCNTCRVSCPRVFGVGASAGK